MKLIFVLLLVVTGCGRTTQNDVNNGIIQNMGKLVELNRTNTAAIRELGRMIKNHSHPSEQGLIKEDAVTLSIMPHIETKPKEGIVAKDSFSCEKCKDTGWCDIAIKGLGYYCTNCEIGSQEWDKRHTGADGKWKP